MVSTRLLRPQHRQAPPEKHANRDVVIIRVLLHATSESHNWTVDAYMV